MRSRKTPRTRRRRARRSRGTLSRVATHPAVIFGAFLFVVSSALLIHAVKMHLRGGGEDTGKTRALRSPASSSVLDNHAAALHPTASVAEKGPVAGAKSAALPRVAVFARRLSKALAPYMKGAGACQSWGWEDELPNHFLPGCAADCKHFSTLDAAKAACADLPHECSGVTRTNPTRFELRSAKDVETSKTGEASWMRFCKDGPGGGKDGKAPQHLKAHGMSGVWTTFASVVRDALADESLHLMGEQQFKVRDDDSIFISVASYRDATCSKTVASALKNAVDPTKVHFGIVQQNCEKEKCKMGTGWAKTRRIVDAPRDPDCVEDFCKTALGSPHCKAGRVRILRLPEREAFGPMFGRFLAAKLWRGENFFLQIDAHIDFAPGWDTTLTGMARATPSYPKSVLSNYPLAASSFSFWPEPGKIMPGGLCGLSFRDGAGNFELRLQRGYGSASPPVKDAQGRWVPVKTGFVAAGFFFAHSGIVHDAPPDPYAPFVFMGEEIELSVRFWTAGYDLYRPAVDVVRHEYVRTESMKFWESVNAAFDDPVAHHSLEIIGVNRVKFLVGVPEAEDDIREFGERTGYESNGGFLLEALAMAEDCPTPAVAGFRSEDRKRAGFFGLGHVRSLQSFLDSRGIDMKTKTMTQQRWCSHPTAPGEVIG